MGQRGLKLVSLALLAAASSGCFFYDSSWGQQKRAQKHEAARSTPQQLRSQSLGRSTRVAERTLRLRMYATPGYAATVLDWQKQFDGLLACANSIFVPDFGASFAAVELKSFRPKASEDSLDGVLSELTAADSGQDVDWVIGLATAEPRFAVSADDLGVAPLLGKHIVMRAMSDPHEYEAIQNGLTELSESERLTLYQVRKHHKLCTVFLHEIAHTLGVPHELLATSLMSPRYNVTAHGFSDEAAEIMRASLGIRAATPNVFMDATLATDLNGWLADPNAGWEAKSRDALLRELSAYGGHVSAGPAGVVQAPVPSSTTPSAASPATPAVEGLTLDEQRSYARARAELSAGRAPNARALAAPLLVKHGNLPAIVSLRCDIATAIGGDWDAISTECPGLSPFGAGK